MSKIKVSELFYSLQGEGRYIGVPSVFLRTFGCNFQCSGFGMPAGERSTEAKDIAARKHEFAQYDDLPLVKTGCDSFAAWMPEFKHLSATRTVDDIVADIMAMLPNNQWGDCHLVITGGEPLLGWQRSYPDLLSHRDMWALKELTFETNGTQNLQPEFEMFLRNWNQHPMRTVTFSVSPKLTASGEAHEDAIKPEIVAQYSQVGYTYLKYVVANEFDVSEALAVTKEYRKAGFTGPVYLMPVGGVESVYYLNNQAVADLATKHGLRYSPRLQVDLYANAWGT